jgi:predicted P-loop ATPase
VAKTKKEIPPSGSLSFGEGWGEDDDEDKPKPTQIDRLELFLSSKYVFRHNIVSGKLEFKTISSSKSQLPPLRGGLGWGVMNDFIENSMLRECLKGRIKTNLSSLRNLLYSDFCQLFNPFEDYFYNLPTYDEKTDYILELANTITTTKQELWQQCFKKWLVAMVGCVLDEKVINHTVIVFSGKQGLGKTTWVEKLVPKQLKEYLFSGTINPNNKDTLVQLAECMLINLDELENLNRSEIGSLKEIITKTQIRMRKAYGHNNETMPRRASFAGSVNTAQFLNDSTGSRRFLCFELEGIKYQHDVNINVAFSQALFLFKSGFRFWFDQEEIKSITENNEQYQLHSPEEELLLTWFEPCPKEEATLFLNASQIAAKLADRTKLNLKDGTINKLGKALKKHNFIRLMRQGKPVYAVKEFTYEEVDAKNKEVEE